MVPALVLVALGALALPAGAHAATKQVYMGTPPAYQKALNQQYGSDANAFFPRTISINAGDSVRFLPVAFHNVDFPPRGQRQKPLLTPSSPITGAVDAAGQPFWFNGQPNIGFNPALLQSGFGKTFAFTPATGVQSGLPTAPKPKPMTVRFARPGTFTYYCDVHPGMKGKVRVERRGRPTPSRAAEAARVRRQAADALTQAKAFNTQAADPGVVHLSIVGRNGVEYFGFVPSNVSVPVGSSLTFDMPTGSYEVHTATTGPGNPDKEPASYLGMLAASLQRPVFDPAAIYPSEPPGAPSTVTPTSHGNGFWNSGVLDALSQTQQVPSSSQVTFTQPGTYEFYCMIHPFMHGTVTAG
jgi:plastocyanin